MKKKVVYALAIGSLTAIAYSADQIFSQQSSDSNQSVRAISQQMEARKLEIMNRVHMTSMLDAEETTDPVTGVDYVQELYENGFIIPATIEEVEAARLAAAKTPDKQDDLIALKLKHRGSYRYFIK